MGSNLNSALRTFKGGCNNTQRTTERRMRDQRAERKLVKMVKRLKFEQIDDEESEYMEERRIDIYHTHTELIACEEGLPINFQPVPLEALLDKNDSQKCLDPSYLNSCYTQPEPQGSTTKGNTTISSM